MSEAWKQDQDDTRTIRQILAPLVALIVGLFMVILDTTAVNVAVPKLVTDFGSTLATVQWAVTGYMLAQAAVIPLAGWLSDRFGAKNIFLVSLGLFTIGSFLCGMAGSIDQLIAFRVFQGLGGGMVMPIAFIFTYRLSPPSKVGAVMGMMGIPILLAPALGPVLSGYLVEYVNWKWIFMINLPVGVIGILLGIWTLPKIERSTVAALDGMGIILGPLSFAALVYGISQGASSWSSEKTLIGLIVGGVALILFVIVELTRRQHPLLELRVFKSYNFSQGIIVQWITQIALFGTIFMVPQFLQVAKGFTPLHSGLTVLPQAIASGIFMPIGGRLFDRFGARPLAIAGLTLVTGAAYLLSRVADSGGDSYAMILPLILLGSGMGLSMMALNTHLIQSAPRRLVSRVTSLTSAAQMVMNSFAVAGLTTILTSRIKDRLTSGISRPEALTSSFSSTFLIIACIAVVGVLLAVMLRRPKLEPQDSERQDQPAEAAMMAGH